MGMRVSKKTFLFLGLFILIAASWETKPWQFASDKGGVEREKLLPITSYTIEKDDYTICYDAKNKIPYWTFEHLTKKRLAKNIKRPPNVRFEHELGLPKHFRSTNHDFHKSGFDRGHLAASANHAYSKHRLKETFTLSNVAPQDPTLNRYYWRSLEEHTRKLTDHFDDVYVISGTAFYFEDKKGDDGKKIRTVTYELIGDGDVAVPNAFYKVILAKAKNGNRLYKAYLIPNTYIEGSPPFTSYQVSIQSLEERTGILFFPSEPREEEL
jgi:endonuclease G, mitochondrial